jgi:hypothetical protein
LPSALNCYPISPLSSIMVYCAVLVVFVILRI